MNNSILIKNQIIDTKKCTKELLAIRDTLDLLNGKWKIPILTALSHGKMRFKELETTIAGISAKMLSKELKDLELNDLVHRNVVASRPITVEYNITNYGITLKPIIEELYNWGLKHRKRIASK